METFKHIEHLLEEQERADRTANLMVGYGMATRTSAGMRFFSGLNDDRMKASRELREYPWHWIEAVKVVQALRQRHDVPARMPSLPGSEWY